MEPGATDRAGGTVLALVPGRDELIDHVFVSQHLVRRTREVRTIAATTSLHSIADDPDEARDVTGSDHAALTAIFDLNG